MKIGIIGLGRVYIHYRDNFINLLLKEGHEIYIYDIGIYINQDCRLKQVYSLDELINQKINFSIISSISGTHYKISKKLLNFGIHVLSEKPPVMSENELIELIQLSKKNSLKYGVIFQNRLNPSMKMAKELVSYKYLGEINICSIRLHWCRYQNYYNDDWHGTWKDDGGVINQQAIHHVDAMQWINGPFLSVSASASNQLNSLEAEDTMLCLINYKNGSVGTIEASTAIRPKDSEASIFISGSEGYIKIGGIALNKIIDVNVPNLNSELESRIFKSSQVVKNGYGYSHKDVVLDFIDSIKTDKEPLISAKSTLQTVRSIHAIYKSVETRKWINVEKKPVSSLLGK